VENVRHVTKLWRWSSGNSPSWFFVTIDGSAGETLSATALMRRLEFGTRAGFGSIRVQACIGASRWQTSVFPQKELGWLLPVKAAVRRAEEIGEGDEVEVTFEF
jgi:hypothetical protein